MGETESGLQQDRSSERLHRDEVDFLFDRKNDIFPEKALCYTMRKKRLCCQIHGSRESKSESILLESDILGKLYAVNAKKIDPSYDRDTIQDSVALTTKRQFDYSVSHLWEDVKGVFTDTFSEDVYDRLGTKRESTDFSENLQYQ